LRVDISKQATQCLEDIRKYLNTHETISVDYIYEMILDTLSEVYARTATAVKNIYGVSGRLEDEEIEKLTYSKDGKSIS
jgi:PII-like signaling protein